jgi:ADP-ribosylglycohydrolase
MALCLANSLLARRDFIPYDQLVRYKWWYKLGYMSSTGQCFDIGAATSQSLREFEHRQKKFATQYGIPFNQLDQLSDTELLGEFNVYCSEDDVAGNGALMRLAPVPLFFYRDKYAAIEFSGRSGVITHGDKKAYDACRFYGALIVAILRGHTKKQILAKNFYSDHKHWFGEEPLHEDIIAIAEGSYKKKAIYPQPDEINKAKTKPVCERHANGRNVKEKKEILENAYNAGVRGKGYIVSALEAALWAFWTEDSFEGGALAAVNLGDDTDTTAAIYGQLAGAWYGYKNLPKEWLKHVYAKKFMQTLSKWIAYEGEQWHNQRPNSAIKRS